MDDPTDGWNDFQNPDNQFVGSTVEDDVAFGLENQGIPREEMLVRVKDALEKVRMAEFASREPARLSGGQNNVLPLPAWLPYDLISLF